MFDIRPPWWWIALFIIFMIPISPLLLLYMFVKWKWIESVILWYGDIFMGWML